ncbi:MAG: endonuclease/exonuclease/phosphatase family protein [bacterium]|nr:endonuclease/exonuclease/phosphatase family protein [bacterium]
MRRHTWWLGLVALGFVVVPGRAEEAVEKPLAEVSWADAADHVGEECIVVGQVVATKNIGSICFLNFHTDYRRHFTAVVRRANFEKFPQMPEEMYSGKQVKVRGTIIDFQGKPEIIVTSPEQITIVGEDRPAREASTPAGAFPRPDTPRADRAPPKPQAAPRVFTGTVTIASYNILNLFDDQDDPYHPDEGTPPKPAAQLQKLAETFRALNADVVALQEVENRGILEQFNRTLLAGLGYEHVVLFEGNDKRGIDVAVLSRLPVGAVTSYRHIGYQNPDGQPARFRRDLLRVRILPPDAQSFDIFVMHLKSKRGGDAATNVRVGEAAAAREVLDDVLRADPDACFVFCGDLNDTFDSSAVRTLVGSGPTVLKAFFDELSEDQHPTYNREPYRSMIDFILCSPAMARRHVTGSHRVLAGTVESSGSDHNPVVDQFKMR